MMNVVSFETFKNMNINIKALLILIKFIAQKRLNIFRSYNQSCIQVSRAATRKHAMVGQKYFMGGGSIRFGG